MSIEGRIEELEGMSKEEAKGEVTANYTPCNGRWGW